MWTLVDWTQLIEFIRGHDAEAAANVEGASDESIRRLTELSPRPLPRNYLSFLEQMGENIGLEGFWPYQSFSASVLLDAVERKVYTCPEPNLFRISLQVKGELQEGTDYYLVLRASDEIDAPVVPRNNAPGEPEPEVDEVPFILSELTHDFAFSKYRLEPSPFRERILLEAELEEKQPTMGRLISVLENSGFESPLPRLTQYWCGTRGTVHAALFVNVPMQLVRVKLAGKDELEAKRWLEILRDNFEVVG